MPSRLLVLSPSRGFLSLCAEGAGSGRPALALGSASAAGAGSDWQPVSLTELSRIRASLRSTRPVAWQQFLPVAAGDGEGGGTLACPQHAKIVFGGHDLVPTHPRKRMVEG